MDGLKSDSVNRTPDENIDVEFSEPLRLPNFHEALIDSEDKSYSVCIRTPLTVNSGAYKNHAKKLCSLIDYIIGPSSNENFPFTIYMLEKQALRYLKLEIGKIQSMK